MSREQDGRHLTDEALALMRRGQLTAAQARLEDASPDDAEAQTLLFLLYRQLGADGEAAKVVARRLEAELTALERSTWLLRYGLVLAALNDRAGAGAALQGVMRLGVNEQHETEARRVLARLLS